jgi:hypothetical protein
MAKKQRWPDGSIFLVPQSDGLSSVAQVLRRTPDALNSVVCAFYDIRVSDASNISAADLVADRLIAIQFTTPDLLDRGRWKVVGQSPPKHLGLMSKFPSLEAARWVGTDIIGSGNIESLLNGYHGLRVWDDWADPHYLDNLLLHPEKKLRNLVYRPRAPRS